MIKRIGVIGAGHQRKYRNHGFRHGGPHGGKQGAGDALGDPQSLAQVFKGVGKEFSGDQDRGERAQEKEPDHVFSQENYTLLLSLAYRSPGWLHGGRLPLKRTSRGALPRIFGYSSH